MTRTRLIVMAAGLLLAGLVVDRAVGGTDPAIIDSSPAFAAVTAQLAPLGPVELIVNDYTGTVTINCDNGLIASGSFDATDIPGLPPGTAIVTAALMEDPPWIELGISVLLGTVDLSALDTSVQCGSSNPVGTVTGDLSNGDTYTVTVNANPPGPIIF